MALGIVQLLYITGDLLDLSGWRMTGVYILISVLHWMLDVLHVVLARDIPDTWYTQRLGSGLARVVQYL